MLQIVEHTSQLEKTLVEVKEFSEKQRKEQKYFEMKVQFESIK